LPGKDFSAAGKEFSAHALCRGEWFATETKAEIAMAENRRMAAARVLKGLTQRQVAELVGTREIEISRLETGRLTPSAEMKQRIALVLGKPTFELFDN
jgi:DNA-binding XRE family transcriptional regulator